MSTADILGVSREHRWSKATDQERKLKPRCRDVVTLGGGKCKPVTREQLERLTRPGTVLLFVHAFLLAEPAAKQRKGGMIADFDGALERLTDVRGGVVEDMETGLRTDTKMKRDAITSHAHTLINRSNQGRRSALNGKRSRGRPKYEPTEAEKTAAKAIWRNKDDYPEWPDADVALRRDVNPQFTAWRAYDIWRGRKPKK